MVGWERRWRHVIRVEGSLGRFKRRKGREEVDEMHGMHVIFDLFMDGVDHPWGIYLNYLEIATVTTIQDVYIR